MLAPKTVSQSLAEGDRILRWIGPLITFGVALLLTLAARRLLLGWIGKRAKGSNSLPALFVQTVRIPSILWCLALAISLSLRFVELSDKWVARADHWVLAFIIISLTLVASSVAVRSITQYGERQGMPFAVAGLSRTLVQIVVILSGLVLLLNELGYDIKPWLTALGVGGLAVALALQDTLANFFAGVHILVERPIFVGDLIRLENGQEGFVTDIGWRTTRLRTGGNDIVVIPNVKITSGILLNCSLPTPRSSAEIVILAAHDADVDRIHEIALEVAAQTPGVLVDPAPVLLFDPGVLLTHLQLKLIVQVESRAAAGGVQSEIRVRLLDRFRAEAIPLPSLPVLEPK